MDPLRSEADAFRILLVVGAGALTVVLVALALGSLAGFIWGLFLVGLGTGRLLARRKKAEPTSRVVLVVDDVVRDGQVAELGDLDGEPEFTLAMVVPPGSPPAELELARQRVEISVQRMAEAGLRTAPGRVLEVKREDLASGRPVPGIEADTSIVSLRNRA